jgi:hypothetical protein
LWGFLDIDNDEEQKNDTRDHYENKDNQLPIMNENK